MTQAETLAREVLLLSRNTLLVNLRFLDAALSQFVLTPAPLPFATDGQKLYYDPRHVLLRYKEEKEQAVRDYLHLVMHCVFRHMYIHSLVGKSLWDLACDIAVEEVINGLGLPSTAAKRQEQQTAELNRLRKEVKQLNAEKLYRYFLYHPPQDPERLRELFRGDDHTPWYPQPKLQVVAGDGENNLSGGNSFGSLSAAAEQVWTDISARMQMDLETFSKQIGRASCRERVCLYV